MVTYIIFNILYLSAFIQVKTYHKNYKALAANFIIVGNVVLRWLGSCMLGEWYMGVGCGYLYLHPEAYILTHSFEI